MDLSGALFAVSITGVVFGALSTFLLGGPWYSPALFGGVWMRLNGVTQQVLTRVTPRVFGLSFRAALLAAAIKAMFLGRGRMQWRV